MTTRDLEPELEQLAKNVKELRRHHRLTREKLAERCGLSAKTIYSIEQGTHHSPTLRTLVSLGRALDTRWWTLVVDPHAGSTTTRWLAALRFQLENASAPARARLMASIDRLSDSPETTTRPMT
ncbi:helix-turn-helix transcriptional regulator [Nannocystaceae bacterium ST9]